MESYREEDPEFVDSFLSSIYVDDLVSGSADDESTYELYAKSKLRLAEAGFRLRKFATNSGILHLRIQNNEASDCRRVEEESLNNTQETQSEDQILPTQEEDQTYAKTSLGTNEKDKPSVQRVLGVEWNTNSDEFLFDISELASIMEGLEPSKRSIVSISARFYDPL